MIVPMKELSVIFQKKDESLVLEKLAGFGCIHIQPGENFQLNLDEAEAEVEKWEDALNNLGSQKSKGPAPLDAFAAAQRLSAIVGRLEEIQTRRSDLFAILEDLAPWGDFQPETLTFLRQNGYCPKLYEIPQEKIESLNDVSRCFRLAQNKNITKVLVLHTKEEESLSGISPFNWPVSSATECKEELVQLGSEEANLKKELKSLIPCRPAIQEALKVARNHLDWERARSGLSSEGTLSAFTAFAPAEKVPQIFQSTDNGLLAVRVDDPTTEDHIPTQIRPTFLSRLAAPVFNLLGTIPGYWERDISVPFLLFFVVFFSMIVGDGGYGLIFLLIGFLGAIASKVSGRKVPDLIRLTLLLSVFTIFWGAITGTWFGNLLEYKMPWSAFLDSLALPIFLGSDPDTKFAPIKLLCFSLGFLHLVIAHLWNFWSILKTGNWLKSLSQIAGLVITTAIFPIVLLLVMSDAERSSLPQNVQFLFGNFPWIVPAAIGGLVGIMVFGNQEGRFLKGLGEGFSCVINVVLGAIGWFSDNISYIRLFAVGLAGFAIAQSFNAMGVALVASVGGPLGFLAGALVLLFGHTLNLAMGLLGVIVHGVRLNMLEFAGRLGMEWTGFEFKPLQSRLEIQKYNSKE